MEKIALKVGFSHHPASGDHIVCEAFFRKIIKCNLYKSAFFFDINLF
jgi:hypothetical protein